MQIERFEDLPLSQEVMDGIEELGFRDLFPIQAQAIIPLLKGRDVIGQARTGTGKTATFGIPMIESLNPGINIVQGIILEPTRELAIQVADHISQIGRYASFKILPVFGGQAIHKQISELKKGVHIVVGTPGRVIDHLKRGTLDLSSIEIVVLDEADRMLDMGFIDDIEYILSRTPRSRQTSLFSATIDQSVMAVCDRYMMNPEKILVSKDEIALSQIEQHYIVVNSKNKFSVLGNVLDERNIDRAIIFCRTRVFTEILTERLRNKGYDAASLHGGLTQPQRNSVTDQFRAGKLKLLVATDVAARGLDIQDVTHIINYDVPLDALVYFHRIGRTARKGGPGTAITLVGYGEIPEMNRIKALTKTTIKETEIDVLASYAESMANPTRARTQMHSATCSACGVNCGVPFKPDLNRPVYCKDCWERRKEKSRKWQS
ncbi:MAG: DEAD/DEAH box helicase [Candidatus Bathyarchaeota archaeon]|nr:MAG: DEAD/DEAH box helicase [Candidatus Bathyarchaeota archaeon]